jgi:hypothetical protein
MMNLSLAQVKKFGSEIQSLKTKHEKPSARPTT